MEYELCSQKTTLAPPSSQLLRLQTWKTCPRESHKTAQSFFYRPFDSAASHHPTNSLIRTTIISCQYSRITSELTTLFPSTPVPLPFSRHMQHFAAVEFCFLPVDILFFHRSRLKVASSVKCLLTAPAPHNCFLQLYLSVLPPPP